MGIRDPIVVYITLHNTNGDHFTVNPLHILWVDHSNEPTSHDVHVNNGAGAATVFTINHAHWLELSRASPFVLFLPDITPDA